MTQRHSKGGAMGDSHIFRVTWCGILWLTLMTTLSPLAQGDDAARARRFVAYYEEVVRPLEIALNRAWWNANTSGKDADYKAKEEAQNQLDKVLSDRDRFAELKAIKAGKTADELLNRQIEVLYLTYLEKQVEPALLQRIASKENEIEQAFNVFRAKVDGKELADSQVRKTLAESKDSRERQAVWEASKKVGAAIERDLAELVRLRNDAARRLGFADFHKMSLSVNEQDQQEVLALFDELDDLTREPFADAKQEIDRRLAKTYGVEADKLRPWHYHDPYFQQPPNIYDVKLDRAFADADIVRICREFYAGVGLPIDGVLKRSDLYERPGKSPHAFCTDIDRRGDVRVLANIVSNENWMSTMLHELGHAVYSSTYIPKSLPYVLRCDSHILTTEGVAMMFERFSKSADWLQAMGVKVEDPKAYNRTGAMMRRNQLLIFSRWCQVMFRFEMEMYANPGQDLNKRWWDLVEKYQMLRRPEGRNAPDYGSKIHMAVAPAYYHNYMMGELFACQLHQALARQVLQSKQPTTAIYTKDPRVGEFMKDKVFGPGKSLSWNALTKHATGERLSAKSFAAEFAHP